MSMTAARRLGAGIAGLALLGLLWAGLAAASDKAAFWMSLRANDIMDRQVATELAPRAGVFVVRAPMRGRSGRSYAETVALLKQAAPGVPVLAYAWVTRAQENNRIEGELLQGLDLGTPVAQAQFDGAPTQFLDVTDPRVREAVVRRLVQARGKLGVDGFAIDLAIRTPVSAKPLSQVCAKQAAFCPAYARGMDEMVGALNAALGERGVVLYNGLWNFASERLQDQSLLLRHADAAAIEYFGMNPNNGRPDFEKHVLAYLELLPRLPQDKPVYFFGRGTWEYADYAADYRWQRYLYASFLLGRRKGDLFKYHSSFQVPVHAGRTGGLDLFADWSLDLGEPRGPYRVEDGLYKRDFAAGRVVVAPDSGKGGRIRLARRHYTPEGESLEGEIALRAGHALILLDAAPSASWLPAQRVIDAGRMAGWGWAQADSVKSRGGTELVLKGLPPENEGEHDVLLDSQRSLAPFKRLEIDAKPLSDEALVLAVAEVDDPKGRQTYAVVVVGTRGEGADGELRPAPQFRVPRTQRGGKEWPQIRSEHAAHGSRIIIDGQRRFGQSEYRFRRWSHVRLIGDWQLSAVRLSERVKLPE